MPNAVAVAVAAVAVAAAAAAAVAASYVYWLRAGWVRWATPRLLLGG